MRTGLAVVMMVGAMATAWYAASELRNTPEILKQAEAAGIDRELTTASVNKGAANVGEVFKLSSPEASTSCMVVKGQELSPGYANLKINPGCDEVYQGLSAAKFWRERADGSVAFMDAENAPVAEFSFGDGVDYESYQPASAMLSLWAEQRQQQ